MDRGNYYLVKCLPQLLPLFFLLVFCTSRKVRIGMGIVNISTSISLKSLKGPDAYKVLGICGEIQRPIESNGFVRTLRVRRNSVSF